MKTRKTNKNFSRTKVHLLVKPRRSLDPLQLKSMPARPLGAETGDVGVLAVGPRSGLDMYRGDPGRELDIELGMEFDMELGLQAGLQALSGDANGDDKGELKGDWGWNHFKFINQQYYKRVQHKKR